MPTCDCWLALADIMIGLASMKGKQGGSAASSRCTSDGGWNETSDAASSVAGSVASGRNFSSSRMQIPTYSSERTAEQNSNVSIAMFRAISTIPRVCQKIWENGRARSA